MHVKNPKLFNKYRKNETEVEVCCLVFIFNPFKVRCISNEERKN